MPGRFAIPFAALQSLRVRVTLAAVVCLTLAVGGNALLSLQQAEAGLMGQTRHHEVEDTARMAKDLSDRIVRLQRALQATAMGIDPVLDAVDESLGRHLAAQAVLVQQFSTLAVIDPDGRVRVAIDASGDWREGASVADRSYFREVAESARPIVSNAVAGRIAGEPVIVLAQPIVRDGRVVAVLAGGVVLSSRYLAANLLDHAEADDDGHLVVVSDAEGRVIAHPSAAALMQPLAAEPRLREALADWQAQGSPAEPSGLALRQGGQVVSAAGVAGTEWVVWRAQHESVLLAPIRAARLDALRNAALVAAAAAVLTFWAMGFLLQPLRRLRDRASRLFDPALDVHDGWPAAGGEIGELARVLRHVTAERSQLEQFSSGLIARLNSVLEAAPIGIAFTREQRFELVSRTWCRLVGRDERALVGAPVAGLFADPADPAALGLALDAAFAAGVHYEGEWRLRRPDGSELWAQLCAQPVDAGHPEAGTIWTLADATGVRAAREHLEWSATHDALTGLANRKGFEAVAERVFAQAPAALMMLDLDRFKAINDGHGHAAGDAMLRAVAQTITAQIRGSDVAARLGGDEFAIVLPGCPPERAEAIAHKLLREIGRATVEWNGQVLSVDASIGVASVRGGMAGPAAWLEAADRACYVAKAAGRSTVCVAAAERTAEAAAAGAAVH